jgi:hypothetical protein
MLADASAMWDQPDLAAGMPPEPAGKRLFHTLDPFTRWEFLHI